MQWMLPTGEALQRVEELQSCNIFPPQVTLAAWRMRQAGSLTVPRLPATISEGREVFVPRADPAPARGLPFLRRGRRWPPSRTFRWPTAASRGTAQGVRRAQPCDPQRGQGGPHRLQRGGQIHLYETAGGADEAVGRHGLPAWTVSAGRPAGGPFPRGLDGLPEPRRYVHQGFDRKGHRLRDGGPGRSRCGRPHRPAARALPSCPACGTGTAACSRAGRCAGPAWPSGWRWDPGILLLDEPTANLDIATRREIMRTLEDLKEINETVVICHPRYAAGLRVGPADHRPGAAERSWPTGPVMRSSGTAP